MGVRSSFRARRVPFVLLMVVTLLATLGGSVPTAWRADAAAGADGCPSGYFCGFSGSNWDGSMMKTRTSMPTLGSWDRKIRSYDNLTPYWVCLDDGANYGLPTWWVRPGSGGGTDPTARSIRFTTTQRACTTTPYPPYDAPTKGRRSTAFGDLDHNGTPDVLSRAMDGRLWFLPGNGSAGVVGSGWNAMTQITRHGDYSGDGLEDVVALRTNGELWLYVGNGKGGFAAHWRMATGWTKVTAVVATGDLNGDGHGDLVVRDGTGQLWRYPGNGKGGFIGARGSLGAHWGPDVLAAAGDVTGDGKNDLLAEDGNGVLWIYPGNGKGTFLARRKVSSGWSKVHSYVGLGDLTGDGVNDLLTVGDVPMDASGDYVGVLVSHRGTGKGGFSTSTNLSMEWWGLNGAF